MPRFRVTIEGSDIEIPGAFAGVSDRTIRGFFVARVVNAPSREEAGRRVLAVIGDEWSRGPYSGLRMRPKLRVAETLPASFLEWLRPKRTGYAFHSGS
jgi:hypothetical protein